MEGWIAIIDLLKDIVSAIISLFKKEKNKSVSEKPIISKQPEEKELNPFLPSDSDIDSINIEDSNYFFTMGAYLATDRSFKDIIVTEREKR